MLFTPADNFTNRVARKIRARESAPDTTSEQRHNEPQGALPALSMNTKDLFPQVFSMGYNAEMQQGPNNIDSDDGAPRATRYKTLSSPVLSLLKSLCVLVSVYAIFHRGIHQRLRTIFDPYSFNGDALQHIAPLWFVWDHAQAANNYIATYYLDAILPPLFKGLYALLTLVLTPIVASKIVTLGLSILFIVTVTATSVKLAGKVAGYLTLLLATGGVLKNLYFMGGIQRGFGIWLASVALYLLTSGNIRALTICGVIAASLYPTATVLIVSALGITLLVLPQHLRGSAATWPLTKRLSWLVGTFIACALVALPQIIAGTRYGERLSIEHETEFPEWSAQGRYTQGDRGVPVAFFPRVFRVLVSGLSASKIRESKEQVDAEDVLQAEESELSPSFKGAVVAVITAIAGLLQLILTQGRCSPQVFRACVFLLSTGVSYAAATLLFPLLYIPSRYIALGVIPLVPALFPCVLTSSITRVCQTLRLPRAPLISLAIGCLALIWLGWSDLTLRKLPSAAGYRPLFKFIRTLPPESVIATWPRGIGNMIPLFTARNVLLFEEGHQIFHRDVTEETRRRMRAIIALYSTTDSTPVERLRQDYGATHILLDTRHLTKTPSYFEPFQSELTAARKATGSSKLYLEQLAAHNVVFTLGPFVLVDVSKGG